MNITEKTNLVFPPILLVLFVLLFSVAGEQNIIGFIFLFLGVMVCCFAFLSAFIVARSHNEKEKALSQKIEKHAMEEQEGQNVLTEEFIATASHNFRTPISELKGYLDLLSAENIFAEQRKLYVHKMQAILQRLYELVQNMLMVSVKVQKRPINFYSTVSGVVDTITADAKMKNLRIAFQSFSDKIMITADPILLTTAIENILSNAIKYATNDTEIKVDIAKKGKDLSLAITNIGVGIPSDEIPGLFTKFHRAQNVLYTYEGSGLGLYIAKQIIHQHGGDITVTSEEGKETTFTMTIPMEK